MSSDEDGSIPAVRPSVRRNMMDDISDDESDDGHLPTIRTPSPGMNNDDDDIKPQRSDSDDERGRSSDGDMPTSQPKIVDAHERRVLSLKAEVDSVELFHFPPVLEMDGEVAREREVTEGQTYPISFRPKRHGDARAAVKAGMQRGPIGLADVLESNARLIEWSDGSKTVMVGDEHYMIVTDKMASEVYLFRKGQDVQTVEAEVNKVGRLQPFGATGMSAVKMARVSSSNSTNGKMEQRKVLLTMKEGGEQEEKAAREEADKKEKDRAKQENKRRQTIHRRKEEPFSPNRYESEEDEEENERLIEERERQIKRPRTNDWSAKSKKAGRRKIVGDDSDDEESDDD